jgi:hypothetical protein
MEKSEVDQEKLIATCLCAPTTPFDPSTPFAIHNIYSQNALDKNKINTSKTQQLEALYISYLLCLFTSL